MPSQLIGSHRLLSELPWWQTGLILYLCTVLLAWPARKFLEGLAYNVAWSSRYGDLALVGVICISARILRRYIVLPEWVTGFSFHFALIAFSVVSGLAVGAIAIYQSGWHESQIVDMIHNFIVVPVYLYLIGTVLPVIYSQGTLVEKTTTVLLLLVWLMLVIFDAQTGRLQQRDWLRSQGVIFPH